jgi:hypothetical protein
MNNLRRSWLLLKTKGPNGWLSCMDLTKENRGFTQIIILPFSTLSLR